MKLNHTVVSNIVCSHLSLLSAAGSFQTFTLVVVIRIKHVHHSVRYVSAFFATMLPLSSV